MRKLRYSPFIQTTNVSGSLLFQVPSVTTVLSPQPPQTLNSSPGNDIADWASRSSGVGVVWAHNFDTRYEVDQFRSTYGVGGIDPTDALGTSRVQWVADGFAGGGCVQIIVPTGGHSDGQVWWRPMSALSAGVPPNSGGTPTAGIVGNGKTVADYAANGTARLRNFNSAWIQQAYNWRQGYWANQNIITANGDYWPTAATPAVYEGTDFWFSVRVKIQGTRWNSGNPPGKLIYIDTMGQTGLQEILVQSVNNPYNGKGHFYQTQPFLMYTSEGNWPNSIIATGTQGDDGPTQTPEPGSQWSATCTYNVYPADGPMANAGSCWFYPADQWTTLLFHVMPGQDNQARFTIDPATTYNYALPTYPYHDQTIEVWKCDVGEAAWTKLYENFNLAFGFETPAQSGTNGFNGNWNAPGYCGISPSAYINNYQNPTGNVAAVSWYHRYTQMILSKEYIPPPGQTAPAWWTN